MTVGASPALSRAATSEARAVIDGHRSSLDIEDFLTDRVPTLLGAALESVLPPGVDGVRCRVTRSKLKPGRKLTVSADVTGPGQTPRPVTATWTLDGHAPSAPSHSSDPAVPRALRSPFTALRVADDSTGMTVLISPLDPAFDQLAELHDPRYLRSLLTSAGLEVGSGDPQVSTVRYRPGQRHVLRIGLASGTTLFAKCYRDDTGLRAVEGSRAIAAALDAGGSTAEAAVPLAYLAAERVVLWEGMTGPALSRVVVGAPELARVAGEALRAIHEYRGAASVRLARSDPAAEAAATLRSCEHVATLAPRVSGDLTALVARTTSALADLPAEVGQLLHGDYKSDNVLVHDGRLTILDFDRVTVGDPALDLGKLCADLRWWAQVEEVDEAPLVSTLLAGYGACATDRLVRAGHYDVLFQLRAAGRRVPLHEPGWSHRVAAIVGAAARCDEVLR